VNSWHIFAYLYQHFDVTLLAAVRTITTQLAVALTKPLVAAVTLWIAGTTAVELYSPGADPLFMFLRKLVRAVLVIAAVSAANYTAVFGTFLLTTLPTELVNGITGATGNGPFGVDGFDTMLGSAWVSGIEVLKNTSGWGAKAIGTAIVVGLFWIGSFLCVGLAFFIFMAMHVLLGVAIALGPIFLCMLLWSRTVRYFDGWIGACLGLVASQGFIVTLVQLLLIVTGDILKQIAALNGTGGTNGNDEFGQLHLMLEAGLMFFGIAYLTKQMPDFGARIMGGVSAGVAPITGMATAAIASGAGMAARGAAAVGGGAVSLSRAAAMRSLTPAGHAP
jgi:hypothetical protein